MNRTIEFVQSFQWSGNKFWAYLRSEAFNYNRKLWNLNCFYCILKKIQKPFSGTPKEGMTTLTAVIRNIKTVIQLFKRSALQISSQSLTSYRQLTVRKIPTMIWRIMLMTTRVRLTYIMWVLDESILLIMCISWLTFVTNNAKSIIPVPNDFLFWYKLMSGRFLGVCCGMSI